MSDLVGLSTGVKPKIADKPELVEGTKYFEMDTLKTYKYSAIDDDWYLYSGGSSGGANPEIINSGEKHLADLDAIAVGWKEEVEVKGVVLELTDVEVDSFSCIYIPDYIEGFKFNFDLDEGDDGPDVEYNGILYTKPPVSTAYGSFDDIYYGFGNPLLAEDLYADDDDGNDYPFYVIYGHKNSPTSQMDATNPCIYVQQSVTNVESIKVFDMGHTEEEYHKISAEYLETANPEIIGSDKRLGDLNEVAVGWYEPEDIKHTELSGTLVRNQYNDKLLTSDIDCNFRIDLPDYPNTTPAPSIGFNGVTYDNLLTYVAGEGVAGFGNPHIFNPSFEYTSVPMFIYFFYEDYDEATRTVNKVRIMSEGDYLDEGPITVKLAIVNSPEQYHGIDAKYIGCERTVSSKVIEFTDEFVESRRVGYSDYIMLHDYDYGFTEEDFDDGACIVTERRYNGEVYDFECYLNWFDYEDASGYEIKTEDGEDVFGYIVAYGKLSGISVGTYFYRDWSNVGVLKLTFNKPVSYKVIDKIDVKYLPSLAEMLPRINDMPIDEAANFYAPYDVYDEDEDEYYTEYPEIYYTNPYISYYVDYGVPLKPSDHGVIDISLDGVIDYEPDKIFEALVQSQDLFCVIDCYVQSHETDEYDSDYTDYDLYYRGRLTSFTCHDETFMLYFGSVDTDGNGFKAVFNYNMNTGYMYCYSAVVINKDI